MADDATRIPRISQVELESVTAMLERKIECRRRVFWSILRSASVAQK